MASGSSGPRQEGRFTELVPLNGGAALPIKNLKPDDDALGWTIDNRVYVRSSSPDENTVHVDKLDPRTGARSAWRDFHVPAIGGLEVETFLLTPDGSSYAYHYHLSLSDLYTITGAR